MKAYGKTDVGSLRMMNQDVIFCSCVPVGNLPNLFIVADGMGGHRAGDIASRCAVQTFVAFIEHAEGTNPILLMEEGIQRANETVLQKAESDEALHGMGTTLVAATVTDDLLYVANVGDSRLYLINEEIHQITRDHSYVEDLVSMGQLDKESARLNQKKNIITRAVGAEENVIPDFFETEIHAFDRILLCSDGLSNMVTDEDIRKIVADESSPAEAVEALIAQANRNGGKDNISAILISPNENESER